MGLLGSWVTQLLSERELHIQAIERIRPLSFSYGEAQQTNITNMPRQRGIKAGKMPPATHTSDSDQPHVLI